MQADIAGVWRSRGATGWLSILGLALGLMAGSITASAHDLPEELTLRAFVKPEQNRLHVVVRLPLAMLLNIDLPKRGPGYIDLAQSDKGLARAAAATASSFALFENGQHLVADEARSRLSQPSEETFGSFAEATAHIAAPPPPVTTNIFWNQGYFDLHLQYPITSAESRFTLDMQAGAALPNRTRLIVHFLPSEGEERIFQVHGGHGQLELDPSWQHATWTFTKLGFHHILDGMDHLLFLFCLILPFHLRQFWALAGTITAFTVAHSITLFAAASGFVPEGNWFVPLVEALIAFSILYMACENVLGAWLGRADAAFLHRRWLVAGLFGLVHGFAFSFILQHQLQLAGAHVTLSLLGFNVGVELAQLALLLVALFALSLLLRKPAWRAPWVLILSLLAAQTAWFWLQERVLALRFARWPAVDPLTVSLTLAVFLFVAVTALLLWPKRRQRRTSSDAKTASGTIG